MLNPSQIKQQIINAVDTVKKTNPMAPSLTNTVTINFVANAQLAIGGSAAMSYLPDECETLARISGAYYINMGTIEPVYEETLPRTAKILHDNKIQWVLDPVAVGIGELRTRFLLQSKKYKPSVIRGNASEVIALAGLWGLDGGADTSRVRGVDSMDSVNAAKEAAVALALWTGGAVAVSGETDLITNGKSAVYSYGGSHFMPKITGSGCALGGVMAVYLTNSSPFIAALTAHSIFNLAGAKAEKASSGPGHFQVNFLDELYKASAAEIADNPLKVEDV